MAVIGLSWWRCPDGVELVNLGPKQTHDSNERPSTLLGVPRFGEWFRARSDRSTSRTYDAVDLEKPIALAFVNTQPQDWPLFFSQYGLLSGGEERIEEVREFHLMLTKAAEIACTGAPAAKSVTINDLLDGKRFNASFDFSDEHGDGRLLLSANTLRSFMCAEIATAATARVGFARCKNCQAAYFTGPKAQRRSDMVTCRDRCRVAFMRRRNKEGLSA